MLLKSGKKYYVVSLFLLLAILITGCGGDSSNYSGVIATATPPPSISSATATPVPTVMSEVSGYVYTIPSTDPGTNGVIITDVPVNTTDSSGNASLLSQVSTYLQQEEAAEWATSDCQEAYNQLTTILTSCQPATGSSVNTSYSDPNSSGLAVNNDGYFSGQLPVEANNSNTELEVATNEDEAYDVETITSSSLSALSTSGLESCPKRIIALPGDIALFEVYSSSENLKNSKLKFTLNNPSIGWVSPPIYLCIGGKNRHSKAYGFVYFKRNLTTPIDTTISAKTNTGLSLDIPVEVVKSTASISGKVFTSKQLVKGYVKSFGPKAYCKLDSAGNYSLPRTYKGHFRTVKAVWWTLENGKKVKYRQVKVIDFLNGDLTGFNFGEEAAPTPTATETPTNTPTPRLATDPYYAEISLGVNVQKWQWIDELGKEQGVQKTVDWLNGLVPDPPVPEELSEAISEAMVDQYSKNMMWIYFKDGERRFLMCEVPGSFDEEEIPAENKEYKNYSVINKPSKFPVTVGSTEILILAPFVWHLDDLRKGERMKEIRDDFTNAGYDVTSKIIDVADTPGQRNENAAIRLTYYDENEPNVVVDEINKYLMKCTILNRNDIITPEDFRNIGHYGVIYISTHGSGDGIGCGVVDRNDNDLMTWINENENRAVIGFQDVNIQFEANPRPDGHNHPHAFELYGLTRKFFEEQNFNNSIVYMNACYSWVFHENGGFSDAKVYLGYTKESAPKWSKYISYYFFKYIMYGYEPPNMLFSGLPPVYTDPPPTDKAMSVKKAYQVLGLAGGNPDPIKYPTTSPLSKCNGCTLNIDTHDGQYDDTYLPAPVVITIKNK